MSTTIIQPIDTFEVWRNKTNALYTAVNAYTPSLSRILSSGTFTTGSVSTDIVLSNASSWIQIDFTVTSNGNMWRYIDIKRNDFATYQRISAMYSDPDGDRPEVNDAVSITYNPDTLSGTSLTLNVLLTCSGVGAYTIKEIAAPTVL